MNKNVVYVLIFVAGVLLADKVRGLPLMNKLPVL